MVPVVSQTWMRTVCVPAAMFTLVSTCDAVVVLYTETLSTYVLISVTLCAVSFVATTRCIGEVMVLPFTGLHIFAPGSVAGVHAGGGGVLPETVMVTESR